MSEGGGDISDYLDSTVAPGDDALADVLNEGEIEVIGRMPYSSNATFLVDLRHGAHRTQAIYKPERGERPLHDFPPGLWRREIAAHLVSEATGWGLVPPTVAREGPLGEGSVQFFCHADYSRHYFTLLELGGHGEDLRRICALDLFINNTDRKSGHVLAGIDGRLWAIDNGLSFSTISRLRTVIWDFAGEALSNEIAAVAGRLFEEDLAAALAEWIGDDEIEATRRRAARLARDAVFPHDPTGRAYPWPLV